LTTAVQSDAADIDNWTRTFAEDQAARAGLSVREWIEQFVARETTPRGGEETPENQTGHAESSLDDRELIASDPEIADPPEELRPEPAAIEVCASPSDTPDCDQTTYASQDEIEQVLDGLLAQVDVVRAQLSAKIREDSARRLDGIERALRGMRDQIQAAEHGGEVRDTPSPGSSPAIETPFLDIARVVEAVDCGFERIEAVGANQIAELRAGIETMFDALAARIDNLERGSVREAPVEAEVETEVENEPPPTVTQPEIHSDAVTGQEFDSDLFDDFPAPDAPTLRDLLKAAPVTVVASAVLAPDATEFEPGAMADPYRLESDDEWAASAPAPAGWAEAVEDTHGPGGGETSTAPSEPLTLATDQIVRHAERPSPPQGKTSAFPWLGFGQRKLLRKSA